MRLLDTSALLEGERDGKILLSVVKELDGLKNSEGLVGKKARDVIKYIYKEAMENFYNEYKDADDKAKNLTEAIIREEESLRQNIRCYL